MSDQKLTRESVFSAIIDRRLGFDYGSPERVDQDSLAVVLPILRHGEQSRIYRTYPEVSFVKIQDTGRIDTMQATNEGDSNVFLRSGTIFKGQTQERTAIRSTVILAGQKAEIKVRCVHQSRGIRMGQQVQYGKVTPLNFEKTVYDSGFTGMDQSVYWTNAVRSNVQMKSLVSSSMGRSKSARPASRSGHSIGRMGGDEGFSQTITKQDDLSSNYAEFTKEFERVLAKVKLVEDQVGVSLITDKGVETVELFDVHRSWEVFHKDAIERLGPDLAKRDMSGVFDYKPEKAAEVVNQVLALPFKENVIHDHKPKGETPGFKVVGLTHGQYTGEVVELDGRLIHMMLLKMETVEK